MLLARFDSFGRARLFSRNCKGHLALSCRDFGKVIRRGFTWNGYGDSNILEVVQQHEGRTAIIDVNGTYTYKDLIARSMLLSKELDGVERLRNARTSKTERGVNIGPRISFLCPNDSTYVVTQWSIWRQGCVAVPLCSSHPSSLLKYFVKDSDASLLIATENFRKTAEEIAKDVKVDLLVIPNTSDGNQHSTDLHAKNASPLNDASGAQIVYSSGTTGRPKGIVSSHGNIRAQVTALLSAWQWTPNDSILHVLPLHHVHGIVNCLLCPLWVGATCVMLPKFHVKQVWEIFQGQVPNIFKEKGITISPSAWPNLFMAVPTIYAKLIEEYNQNIRKNAEPPVIKEKMTQLRLMVSGSASLPVPIMSAWEDITGHTLLERYGMTEIGMALSNPYEGTRVPGSVGNPLPGVKVRLVDDAGKVVTEGDEHGSLVTDGYFEAPGELQVCGPSVFSSYWNRQEATKESFTEDGWFKTGDTAVFSDGNYKILGRSSVDIIKKGGYKISALDIERHLLAHELVMDCAVLGIPDDVWGEQITAIIVLSGKEELTLADVRAWLSQHLPPYSLPSALKVMKNIPRNVMGKVNKKELRKSVAK